MNEQQKQFGAKMESLIEEAVSKGYSRAQADSVLRQAFAGDSIGKVKQAFSMRDSLAWDFSDSHVLKPSNPLIQQKAISMIAGCCLADPVEVLTKNPRV